MFLSIQDAVCKIREAITIGDGALIGQNVVLATLNHDINPIKRSTMHPAPIVIGNNVWIGAKTTVVPGVIIGDCSSWCYSHQCCTT
ncbi:DapH/DapD/GlmU-related protein [Halalkalibacter sp. AB-rgal2]|uniref:acyltransferase n=1 Tax=Halalkalibacter sp. AB-rgal2 TaxID=3242695 RepID=UPI00359D2170